LKSLLLYTDGASWGNPGPAAIGAIVRDGSGAVVGKLSAGIGRATNNQAEYKALIAGLKLASKLGAEHVAVNVDSELVARQLKGEYRVRNATLKALFREARQLLKGFGSFSITHIPREGNEEAHRLAKKHLIVVKYKRQADRVTAGR
jgi:ribonuclease HI